MTEMTDQKKHQVPNADTHNQHDGEPGGGNPGIDQGLGNKGGKPGEPQGDNRRSGDEDGNRGGQGRGNERGGDEADPKRGDAVIKSRAVRS